MKFYIFFIMCLVFCAHAEHTSADADTPSLLTAVEEATLTGDGDGKLNFTQLANKYGHSLEQYDVVTEDGYILTVFRIPGEKPPVLLFHGLTASSVTFILRGNTSLIITLAAEGYDVWVGNNRGNLHGRRHVCMDPDTDKKFWDFSFHEIGYYDLAATIDFVRNKTGADKISTIGHSQGTSAHFVLTSLRPEYNERIKIFIALAPIAFMNDMPTAVALLADAGPLIATALKLAGIVELLRNHAASTDLITFICSKDIVSYLICGVGFFYPIIGIDLKAIEPKFLSVIFGHYPSAISRKCLEHYVQVMLRRSFAQYDFGLGNILKYGSPSPPEYELKKVSLKVALFAGRGDKLGTVKNIDRLRDTLPNVVRYEVMKPAQWGHMDFIVSKYMPKYLYPPILDLLKKYN